MTQQDKAVVPNYCHIELVLQRVVLPETQSQFLIEQLDLNVVGYSQQQLSEYRPFSALQNLRLMT